LAIVGPDKRVELREIRVGHDFGSDIEIVAGLNGNESIIVNPPDSIVSGQSVRIALPASPAQGGGATQ